MKGAEKEPLPCFAIPPVLRRPDRLSTQGRGSMAATLAVWWDADPSKRVKAEISVPSGRAADLARAVREAFRPHLDRQEFCLTDGSTNITSDADVSRLSNGDSLMVVLRSGGDAKPQAKVGHAKKGGKGDGRASDNYTPKPSGLLASVCPFLTACYLVLCRPTCFGIRRRCCRSASASRPTPRP